MRHIFLMLSLILMIVFANKAPAAGRLTDKDFKTLAEIQAVSGTAANLLNDTKVYITANGLNKQLSAAITAGDLAGAGSVLNVSTTAVSVTMPATTNVMIASAPVTITLLPAASYTAEITIKRNFTTSGVVLIQTSSGQLIEAVSASTSLVNYYEAVKLIPTSTGFVYADNDAKNRKFGMNWGGVSEYVPCGANPCISYYNTGAVSDMFYAGSTGAYQLRLIPQTCRSKPICTAISADNVNYQSVIPANTTSSTAYAFNTGTGAANNGWGSILCSCDRW